MLLLFWAIDSSLNAKVPKAAGAKLSDEKSEYPFLWDGESVRATAWADGFDISTEYYPSQVVLAGMFEEASIDLGERMSIQTRDECHWIPKVLLRDYAVKGQNEYPHKRTQLRIASEAENVYLDLNHPDVLAVLDGWRLNGRGDFIR